MAKVPLVPIGSTLDRFAPAATVERNLAAMREREKLLEERRAKIEQGFPLARTLGNERLAVADPVTVPAGKYARAALMSLGVWDSVAAKLAPAENVRAALLLVSRGETPLGIVYATDAAADRGVTVVGEFPASTHPPIVYPAALTHVSSPAAVSGWTSVTPVRSNSVLAPPWVNSSHFFPIDTQPP